MKKLNAFLFAFILFGISIVLIDMIGKQILSENKKSTIYNNVDERNSCEYMMEQILAENAIPVLGSSELSAADEVAYPPALFQNGNSDFNMILIGRGYMQSLHFISAMVYRSSFIFRGIFWHIFREDVC